VISDELRAVLHARLGKDSDQPLAGPTVDGVRRLLRAAGLWGNLPDPDVTAALSLAGVDHGQPQRMQAVAAAAERVVAAGLLDETVPVVLQAFARGTARIAAAEAEAIVASLHDTPEPERAALLEDLLAVAPSASEDAFGALHAVALHDALVSALSPQGLGDVSAGMLAIACVDLISSTTHLASASVVEVEQMVDALFEAGQSATAGRDVQAVKYVGDGVFLAGTDPAEVTDAALDALRRLRRLLSLEARAGLSYGEAVRRAGDIFGLPVNVAHLLTKAADPGTLLVDEPTAERLPPAMRVKTRSLVLHPALDQVEATEVRPVGLWAPPWRKTAAG
jgi:adenylate cyclase